MKLRCLIVDDEIHCRHDLRFLLGQAPDTTILADCASITQARQHIVSMQPDLVFLDIQMGLQSGFDLLQSLASPPLTIFVTAFDKYAAKAFNFDVVDYLLKPVHPQRLAASLARVRQRISGNTHLTAGGSAPSQNPADQLIPLAGSGAAAAIHDILLIEARNHHSRVTVTSGIPSMVRRTMREWQQLLPASTFMQIDRSMLVNLAHVISVECNSRGGRLILGPNRVAVSVGRTGSARLRQLLRQKNDSNG